MAHKLKTAERQMDSQRDRQRHEERLAEGLTVWQISETNTLRSSGGKSRARPVWSEIWA